MKLSECLRLVAAHEQPGKVDWDWEKGLCANIANNFGHLQESTAKCWMSQHPTYSGSWLYPIPACPDALHGRKVDSFIPSHCAYHTHYDTDLYTGTYGRARRGMALYLSDLFAKQGL